MKLESLYRMFKFTTIFQHIIMSLCELIESELTKTHCSGQTIGFGTTVSKHGKPQTAGRCSIKECLSCKVYYGVPCTVWSNRRTDEGQGQLLRGQFVRRIVDHLQSQWPWVYSYPPRTLLYGSGQWAGIGSRNAIAELVTLFNFRGVWQELRSSDPNSWTASPDDDESTEMTYRFLFRALGPPSVSSVNCIQPYF